MIVTPSLGRCRRAGGVYRAADRPDSLFNARLSRWTIFGDRPDLAPADAFTPVLELLGQP